MRLVLVLVSGSLLLTACSGASSNPVPDDAWDVDSFLYQLQRADPQRIGETAFDLLITSIDVAGSSPKTVPALKESPGGAKTVLAYLSIGQAEDYRFYWDADWKQDPPMWLDRPDPNWRGDYWVRYWDQGWQDIIFGSPDAYLDRIIALGFDGIYLDRVDAYEVYEGQGRETAAREMTDFVIALADYARSKRPGFGVFPQNAEELGTMFNDYLETVDGIGVEDLYYGAEADHVASPPAWTTEREKILDQWIDAGKVVLTTDYTAKKDQIADAYRRSLAKGYIPYVADRSLGRLRINEGFEPDRLPDQYDYSVE